MASVKEATEVNGCCPFDVERAVPSSTASRERTPFQGLRLAEFHTRGGPE